MDGHVAVRERPSLEDRPPEVDDADAVGLRCRFQGAFPHRNPVGVCRKPEIGKEPPDFGVLLTDASVVHRGGRQRICVAVRI